MEKPKRIRISNYFAVEVFLENPEEELDAAVKLYREAKVAFGKVLNARPGSEQERYRKIYQETVRDRVADFECDLEVSDVDSGLPSYSPSSFACASFPSSELVVNLTAIEKFRQNYGKYRWYEKILKKLDRLKLAANSIYQVRLPKTSQYLKVINDFTRTVESLAAVS